MDQKFFAHATADVSPQADIGEGTKIWQHCQVREGAVIGRNCILSKGVYIDTGVRIGNNVKIQNGISVYHGVTLQDGVFCGPHCVFTNDRQPRSINPDGSLKSADDWVVSETLVKTGASIGAHATIVCGTTIGRWAMIGAGAVVGFATEVARSYLADRAHTHACQVLDSILDEDVNFSASCTTANLRIDQGPVWSPVKGQKINTGRNKLGLIAGKKAFIGVNVMTMPGVKIGREAEIGPTTVVRHDVPDRTRVWVEQTLGMAKPKDE